MSRFIVCSAEPWGQRVAWPAVMPSSEDTWEIVTTPGELARAERVPPRPAGIFVLHWHEMIPEWVVARNWCVGFHASDLPNFRGGDPIGNQQARGITATLLTAFRLTPRLDAGPILLQRGLSLMGTRADVLARIATLVPGMVAEILSGDIAEHPQPAGGSFYRRADAHAH